MRTFTKTAGILLGSGLLLSVVAAPSLAGAAPISSSSNVDVTVSGGTVAATTYGTTLDAVILNGSEQTTKKKTGSWLLTDARGTGAAWALTATATDFTSAIGDTDTTVRTIPAANLAINLTSIAALGSSDAAPTASSVSALSSTVQSTLVSATSSKGSYSVLTPEYALTVPANAFRSNFATGVSGAMHPYVSTVTFTIG